MVTAVIIGAGQRGYYVYSDYISRHREDIRLVAVAEPDEERRNRITALHDIPRERAFGDWKELLGKEKMADAVIISTNDHMHYELVKTALEKGYHILVEKPMSNREEDVEKMAALAKQYPDRVFAVAHVLRYTSFFETLKKLLDSGTIGDVVSVQHNENIGYYHMAHSFVRGNWRNSEETSPIILAKSCHDMDILLYLVGSHCKKVASFGNLKHFCRENAPEGAAARCLDCPLKDSCAYSAVKIYRNLHEWPAQVITNDHTEAGREKALRETNYGRCVYDSDNNVMDHQVTILEFENGVTATFHLSAFTHQISRTIKVMGSQGEIRGDMEKNSLEIYRFSDDCYEQIDTSPKMEGHVGHGGGDEGFAQQFVKSLEDAVNGDGREPVKTSALVSLESHKMAWAAENSRITGKVIEF